jgi:LytS/YehU family sensor histidine kinase
MLLDKGLRIEVTNNGKLRTPRSDDMTGIGLRNVHERLDKLFPGKSNFRLSEREGSVTASIEIFQ